MGSRAAAVCSSFLFFFGTNFAFYVAYFYPVSHAPLPRRVLSLSFSRARARVVERLARGNLAISKEARSKKSRRPRSRVSPPRNRGLFANRRGIAAADRAQLFRNADLGTSGGGRI